MLATHRQEAAQPCVSQSRALRTGLGRARPRITDVAPWSKAETNKISHLRMTTSLSLRLRALVPPHEQRSATSHRGQALRELNRGRGDECTEFVSWSTGPNDRARREETLDGLPTAKSSLARGPALGTQAWQGLDSPLPFAHALTDEALDRSCANQGRANASEANALGCSPACAPPRHTAADSSIAAADE